MSTDDLPGSEALRLADAIDPHDEGSKVILTIDCAHAATMLRRMVAELDLAYESRRTAQQQRADDYARLLKAAQDAERRQALAEAERDKLRELLRIEESISFRRQMQKCEAAREADAEAMRVALRTLNGTCTNPLADPEQAALEDSAIAALRARLEANP